MSNQKFAPIRAHFAPEPKPKPKPAQVRNKRPLTPREKERVAALSFEVKCLEAELEAWRGKLERSGVIPSREAMIWNRRQRYAPVRPHWLEAPGDTRS